MDKRNWFPELHQFAVTRNESYLHSVWVGIYLAVFMLPYILWTTTVHPVLRALINGAGLLFRFLILIPMSGLAGNLSTHGMSREEVVALAIAQFQADNS